MANFQKSAKDTITRFDSGNGRVVLLLGENGKIDLWGGGPAGSEIVVGPNADGIVDVSPAVGRRLSGDLQTYELKAMKAGNVMLEARVFNSSGTPQSRRNEWFTKPVWAYIQVSVLAHGFAQAGGTWGNLKYGSMNQAWKSVQWTTMAYSGCGPTALATVLDYLFRLSPSSPGGVSPLETMGYTSQYGRVAAAKAGGPLLPQGTSGDTMFKNLDKHWPGYAAEEILSVDTAVGWLRAGTPVVFLAGGAATTWKLAANGTKDHHSWKGGHYMVLLGVEDGPDDAHQVFWVSDPSLARTRYTSRADLESCRMWRVYAK